MTAQQLKNAILQEAIAGRLVPQDPNDEPASVLLEHIREEKLRLVKEGKLKKKNLIETPISEDEKPFDIPESWEWCRLISLSKTIHYGYTASAAPRGNSMLLRITDIQNDKVNWATVPFCTIREKDLETYQLHNRDILIARTGGTIGKTYIVRELNNVSVFASYLIRAIPLNSVFEEYLKLFMSSPCYWSQLTDAASGTGQPNVNGQSLSQLLVPLPPLAEQKRIVEKIEELLPKVEAYGKAQESLNKLNEELPERLKKSVLQEAIEGRLVPQDPNDEPAPVLLEHIREEKLRLVKEGKLKKKDLEETPISEDEKPFDIPESWEWCRLGDIGIFERGNGIKRDETSDSGYPCVRYGEMYTKYKYAPTFDKTVSFTNKSVFDKCRKAHKGDLFMALTGENKQDISLAAQYIGEEEIAVGGDLCHFTILEAYALYFVYLINSKYFSSKKELHATGDIIVHISTDKLSSIAIPLPPLAEQKRIVEKIEELFAKIDNLTK